MEKEIIINFFKKIFSFLSAYAWPTYKERIIEALRRAFEVAKDTFIEVLWKSVKDDLTAHAKEACEYGMTYTNTSDFKEKEEAVVTYLFTKIKFPLPLRPFKGLIKNLLKKKIETFIKETLENFQGKLA